MALNLLLHRDAETQGKTKKNRQEFSMPGITTIRGMIIFKNAAKGAPFWTQAKDLAAGVRWTMYWLNPRQQRLAIHMPPRSITMPGRLENSG
jgi:hypothetical protein